MVQSCHDSPLQVSCTFLFKFGRYILVLRIFRSVNFRKPWPNKNVSRRGFPNKIWDGESLLQGSGVFRSCIMARMNLSLLIEPLWPTLVRSSRLVDFTATSARPFERGQYADDTRCLTHHVLRNRWYVSERNSGPPSLDTSSGTPYVWQNLLIHCTRPRAPLPGGDWYISLHPESLSPMTK